MSLIGALKAVKAGQPVKKAAPFYSAVDEALANLKRPKGTGAEFLTEVMKTKGVKKAEIADRKLEQAFKDKGKMTKEEAQQVLKDNPPPKLSERELTEISDDLRDAELRDKIETSGYDSWDEVPSRIIRKWNEEIDENLEKYGDYRTPGGSNYREILLKLPESFTKNDFNRLLTLEAEQRRGELTTAQLKELVNLQAKKQTGPSNYISGHWQGEPNVLAHMRVQDRTGPNGEKILHVEEIQSDWHQEGRKKGYAQPETSRMTGNVVDAGDGTYRVEWPDGTFSGGYNWASAMEKAEQGKSNAKPGVPDAPFKKNWHELAMKRLLNYAADNGYDSIAITPGMEQAKRYDLSKQIDQIKYIQNQDGTFDLAVRPKGQTRDTMHIGDKSLSGLSADDLEGVVGKEVTQKILAGEGPQGGDNYRALTGVDLQVGGEGMKGFYDQILPSYLNTFGKPYGAQVQQLQIPVKHELQGLRTMGGYPEEPPLTMHNFPITPEMRQQIQQKGLPLYQQIGIPTAGAGAASQMLEPEEPQYGTGGAIAKMAKKAIPVVRAPEIIKPSGLTELKKIVEQEKGGYGARRLERAADEIPNLEKLYKQAALKEAFTGDNARALMTMNPADFEKYAAKIPEKLASDANSIGDKWGQSTSDYVKYLTSIDRFDDVPFLLINKQESGLPLMPFINGHEGRHRNRALASRGEQSNLVQLLPRAELREPFPRRSQQEYIEALKQEMEMTGNKVKPELYFDDSLPKNLVIDRPPIDLPDIYATGGSVKRQVKKADGGAINYNTAPDMSDGGRIIQGAPFKHGGKVNMTTNRDAMFMELSNKKLKRK